LSYIGKTDWKYDDIVTEQDINRIEQGVQDAHTTIAEHMPHIVLSADEPTSSSGHLFWLVDLGDDPDFICDGEGGIVIANASMDGSEPIQFDLLGGQANG